MDKNKILRDPIYGYISIPEEYCKEFIDTEIFQRLRRIEQTSMRVLYPSAHHDRFAHSIGVFHLGSLAFASLRSNSISIFQNDVTTEQWEIYRKTFEIACLMHDCGHSPFSHTFEHYYLYNKENNIKNRISAFFCRDANFSNEFDENLPAEHEQISGLLLLERYKDKLEKCNANPTLAARMIMGIKHQGKLDTKERIENKLISLLNGSGFDVDSLDYIQRDSWASGVSNVNIDYHRFLSSIMLKPDKHGNIKIVFHKKVLSVLENINIGRNFLYQWIYSHHKVIYEQDLLQKIMETLIKRDTQLLDIFTIETFYEVKKICGCNYYLPSDDDIIFTMKNFFHEDVMISEYFSHNHKYRALWKTYFEFDKSYFRNVSGENRMGICARIEEGNLRNKYGNNSIKVIKAKPKLKSISQNDYFIDINNELIDASLATKQKKENLSYFIVYVVQDLLSRKEEIIHDILSLQS